MDDKLKIDSTEKSEKLDVPLHPINKLNELNEDIFGHLDVHNYPSTSKRRKLTRRMDRKLNKEIPLPEPIESISEITDPITKWDKKTLTVKTTNLTTQNKIIGCSRYEDTNKTFVNKTEVNVLNVDNTKNHLGGTKLSIDEIKALPQFKNYQLRASPNKILYLKNLSKSTEKQDLVKLFQYHQCTNIRIMFGKLRGQAFVTFISIEAAKSALDELNDLILKGKPIIMDYALSQNSDNTKTDL